MRQASLLPVAPFPRLAVAGVVGTAVYVPGWLIAARWPRRAAGSGAAGR
jgi:hypothetical protein